MISKLGHILETASPVWTKFALWLLEVELKNQPFNATITALYRRKVAGDNPSLAEWRTVRSTSCKAAWSEDIDDATWIATWAARNAAWSRGTAIVDWAAKASGNPEDAWRRYNNKLLELVDSFSSRDYNIQIQKETPMNTAITTVERQDTLVAICQLDEGTAQTPWEAIPSKSREVRRSVGTWTVPLKGDVSDKEAARLLAVIASNVTDEHDRKAIEALLVERVKR